MRTCRFLLRDIVAGFMTQQWPKWAAVDAAVSKEGWKLITLLRLSPIIPWNVLNYALSVTGASSSLQRPPNSSSRKSPMDWSVNGCVARA